MKWCNYIINKYHQQSVPTPKRNKDQPFLMPIEDVFTISGHSTVATGWTEREMVKVGDELEIVGLKQPTRATCTGVEMFCLDIGEAGDNVGILLRVIDKCTVERGRVLCKPKSINTHSKFIAEVYALKKMKVIVTLHSSTITNHNFISEPTDITETIILGKGTEMVMPEDNTTIPVNLSNPVALEEGLGFAIREGGRMVGAGTITKVNTAEL